MAHVFVRIIGAVIGVEVRILFCCAFMLFSEYQERREA